MGQYINEIKGNFIGTTFLQKCKSIKDVHGSIEYPGTPKIWEENMVCVVDNGPFAAAAYIYNEDELKEFSNFTDWRNKRWFNLPNAKEYVD